MAQFKQQGEPFVFNFKKLLKALSGKEAVAQLEVDAFMEENCAKRWQTKKGRYQLKRRRLLPVQEQTLIWLTSNCKTTWRNTTWWTRTFEGLRGARMFHLVSLS